ncbi:class I SAM-dependent rRNA methyltransferase [Paenalkalicoccus suaedae]|uniref:Class I SAM-dependent rRNA methyltransferase n=1 Tax=Paenalkalicoccus suaedae TaxID=2592382 RepID=A0A859FIJ1_9BACI|nr:class I SAM-dependent rRNA methyltransferase [Paenalkalicoccus suaedae]QKS72889.1 class I SAM-dependent rRNA methyltransferase [Paenalkalicoccus suaedae]
MDKTVKIKQSFEKKYRQGYPLLTEEALVSSGKLHEEGELLQVVTEDGDFIGYGYHGRQNKGVGWILTHREHEAIDQRLFDRKLIEAVGRRSAFFLDETTTAFRVFNGEGDGIGGVTIDNYAGYYVIQWYSRGVYQFKDYIVHALQTYTDCIGIYEKKRFAKKGEYVEDNDFVSGEEAPSPLIVKENGVNLAVYLNDGAMTGIFLDQREVRKMLMDHLAADRSVLNTFSYTGAFSVFAAMGGASGTTSVDVANRSLEKTSEQFRVNHLPVESQKIIVDDVFVYYKRATKREEEYDVVVVDPPSFARTKKTTFSAAKDYAKLLKETIALTRTGGTIVASTNHAGLSRKKFRSFIDQAFDEAGHTYRIVEQFRLPEDFVTLEEFPEGNYLKVYVIEKLKAKEA